MSEIDELRVEVARLQGDLTNAINTNNEMAREIRALRSALLTIKNQPELAAWSANWMRELAASALDNQHEA